ncbi:MAG: 2-iminobutanoate/2-iminopropanoate deaminase [Chthoniobacter sp.]|jgi:2-iminobutanoate/2-iminopropanoate deaminase|nr:2-iminobutanoate/2-iminopropanoate deaminase [Chthoniobacter sp.]
MKTVIASTEAPRAIGPYSQAIAVGNMLFCAGQIPLSPATGELAGDDVTAQTTRVLENLGAVLRSNSMTYANVVKTTVFLIDLADFAAMNDIYAIYFPEQPPARSTIQVAALPKGARVEIEAIAVTELVPKSPSTFAAPVDTAPASPL